MANTPPKGIIRDGNLKASIWENQSEKGPFYTTTFAKTYRDDSGELRDTQGFAKGDLLRVAELARASYSQTMKYYRDNAPSRNNDAPSRQDRADAFERDQNPPQDLGHEL